MTNTFIANGKSTKEEIIKATKYGLYCESFNGGSVDPATDKFNFTASKAYIVKDGKIDHLVRAASLVGYGYEILPKIDMVANDCARGEGMCGAASGSVPADSCHLSESAPAAENLLSVPTALKPRNV